MGVKAGKKNKKRGNNSKKNKGQSPAEIAQERARLAVKLKETEGKLANLNVKEGTRVSGGSRIQRKKSSGNHINFVTYQKKLNTILKKYPYFNVNNQINRIGIFLMNRQQITIYSPNPKDQTTNQFSRIRYLKDYNCFVVQLKDQKIECREFAEDPSELSSGVREIKRKERKFKREIEKKCSMQRVGKVASLIFDLDTEFWQFLGPELYEINRCFYLIFGELHVARKNTPNPASEPVGSESISINNPAELPDDLPEDIQKQLAEITQISGEEDKIRGVAQARSTSRLAGAVCVPELVEVNSIPGPAEPPDEPEPEHNLPQDDINLVVQEGGVSRIQAIHALIQSKGDIVDAILALT